MSTSCSGELKILDEFGPLYWDFTLSAKYLRALRVLLGRLSASWENGNDDDDEFRFNDASTHEGHLRQNGELTWFCSETIIMISHKCIKCKTRTNLKIKAVILC